MDRDNDLIRSLETNISRENDAVNLLEAKKAELQTELNAISSALMEHNRRLKGMRTLLYDLAGDSAPEDPDLPPAFREARDERPSAARVRRNRILDAAEKHLISIYPKRLTAPQLAKEISDNDGDDIARHLRAWLIADKGRFIAKKGRDGGYTVVSRLVGATKRAR